MIQPVQIHLMVVHVPVLATVFATLLLLASGFRDRQEWRRMAYAVFLIAGLSAVLAFFSGGASEDMAETLFGVTEAKIEAHEEIATIGLALSLAAALCAFFLLFLASRFPTYWKTQIGRLLLLLGLIGSAVFAVAAHRGGLIRHPELKEGGVSSLLAPRPERP